MIGRVQVLVLLLGVTSPIVAAESPAEDSLSIELVADQGAGQALKYSVSLVPGGAIEFHYDYGDSTVGYQGNVLGDGLLDAATRRRMQQVFSEQLFFELPQALTFIGDDGAHYRLRISTPARTNEVAVTAGKTESPELMRFWHSWLAVMDAVPAQPRVPVP